MAYVIRRLEDNFLPVLAMDEACFPVDERVNLSGAVWWIVWCGREPVGFAGLYVCREPENVGLGFLSRAGVVPAHRGHGLQKRLLRTREREARRMGLRELVTYCVPDNLPSANSLIACGYKLYAPTHRWGGAAAMYFRKSLA
jgi:RimJ/RimL family protein N-acetyltransferase